jgi:hypothetical protein
LYHRERAVGIQQSGGQPNLFTAKGAKGAKKDRVLHFLFLFAAFASVAVKLWLDW